MLSVVPADSPPNSHLPPTAYSSPGEVLCLCRNQNTCSNKTNTRIDIKAEPRWETALSRWSETITNQSPNEYWEATKRSAHCADWSGEQQQINIEQIHIIINVIRAGLIKAAEVSEQVLPPKRDNEVASCKQGEGRERTCLTTRTDDIGNVVIKFV